MDGRIIILKEHILNNLNHQWTIDEMAQTINISKSHFQKLFKGEMSISPLQYVKQIRLKKAKELLVRRDFPRVQEICFKIGIENQSHFNRDFKKEYGMTPTELRRHYWDKYETKVLNS